MAKVKAPEKTWIICPACNGAGAYEDQIDVDLLNRYPCGNCQGDGEVEVEVEEVAQ